MIGKGPAGPTIRRAVEEAFDLCAEMGGGKLRPQHVKGIGHVQAASGRVVGHDLHRAMWRIAHLAHHGAIVICVQQRADPFQPGDVFRARLGIDVVLHVIGVDRGFVLDPGQRTVRAELCVVEIVVHGIQPEAIDPPVQPEAHHLQQPVLHIGVVKVQIRLAGQEVVQIILPPPRVPFPGRAAEDRHPVVRRAAIGQGIGPDIPVGLGVGAACPAFGKERVAVGRVAENLVDDHFQPQVMGTGDHGIEIVQRPEQRINSGVVGHVIPHVRHGRGEDRRQPDRICTKVRNMGQALRDARKVADAVARGILKGPWVNLIRHRAAPPVSHAFPLLRCILGRAESKSAIA